ncbi:DUF3592 domain-containing protein [Aeromonas jandaei]|uniref:DUF3592 domain-containing protein n=1 Tax=Aeromonas jandaei TaxID=650 RepID=UPI003987E7BD
MIRKFFRNLGFDGYFLILIPISSFGLALVFLWVGGSDWYFSNELKLRGEVAEGRVIKIERRSYSSGRSIFSSKMSCLTEFKTALGQQVRKWDVDGVYCPETYFSRKTDDNQTSINPTIIYLPESPIRATSNINSTSEKGLITVAFSIPFLMVGIFVFVWIHPVLRVNHAYSTIVLECIKLGEQKNYNDIIALLNKHISHPIASNLAWEAAKQIAANPEIYKSFIPAFKAAMEKEIHRLQKTLPLDYFLERVEFVDKLSFLVERGYFQLAIELLTCFDSVCSDRHKAILVLKARAIPLMKSAEGDQTALADFESLLTANSIYYGSRIFIKIESEINSMNMNKNDKLYTCSVDIITRLEFLLWACEQEVSQSIQKSIIFALQIEIDYEEIGKIFINYCDVKINGIDYLHSKIKKSIESNVNYCKQNQIAIYLPHLSSLLLMLEKTKPVLKNTKTY